MYADHGWKKNILKLSPNIRYRVGLFKSDSIVAACVRKVSDDELREGRFGHLGIQLGDDGISLKNSVLPAAENGRYSQRNLFGYEIIHSDEPKVTKSWSIPAPNYGDWSKGTHDVTFDRDVYRREFVPPQLTPLTVKCLGHDVTQRNHVLRFAVEHVLDRRAPQFERSLLFDLNLLQENIGSHNVYESDTSLEDYLRTLYVNWEILPPGERADNIIRILSGVGSADPKIRARLIDRYTFLEKLGPESFVRGVSGFHRYFGAKFSDNLVVFENTEYGNALYMMSEDWQELSRLSRTELLSSDRDFLRIAHTKTWKHRLRSEVLRRRRPTT